MDDNQNTGHARPSQEIASSRLPISNKQREKRSASVSANRRVSSIPCASSVTVRDIPFPSRIPLSDKPREKRSSSVCASRRVSSFLLTPSVTNRDASLHPGSGSTRIPLSDKPREKRSSSVCASRRVSNVPSEGANAEGSKPTPFRSRTPEVRIQKKKLFNSQVTSVTSVIYDENWASKQTKSYTEWLNHVFTSSLGTSSSASHEIDSTELLSNGYEGWYLSQHSQ